MIHSKIFPALFHRYYQNIQKGNDDKKIFLGNMPIFYKLFEEILSRFLPIFFYEILLEFL